MNLRGILAFLVATAGAAPAGAQAPDAALATQVAPAQPTASATAISQAENRAGPGQDSLNPPQVVARSQTQPGPAEPIGGADRCDPVRLKTASAAVREACGRTLERRADEFSRPATTELSPSEGVIASGANTAANGVSASATASGLPAGMLAADAVAAQTQRPASAPAPKPPAAPQLDPALAAVVTGVLNGITVQTRP